ncbi:threonylcarbamoyl-AMP synthase [Marinomonas agarivorans]|nr:threonylcarbamoyl-AMP synthase [Marinomonas agarivorans]
MSQFFQIHPDNPQIRLIRQAAEVIRNGGVIAYPTDCGYSLGCHIGDKAALDRIRTIRRLTDKHNFTLVCKDLSEISTYARFDNSIYRLLKHHTPGPYTFIFNATSEVPRRLLHPKRKTIGIRVPDNKIVTALLEELGEPIMSSSLILPNEDIPMAEPYEIRDILQHQLDLVIDGGYCGIEPTTVVQMDGEEITVLREGAGETTAFI